MASYGPKVLLILFVLIFRLSCVYGDQVCKRAPLTSLVGLDITLCFQENDNSDFQHTFIRVIEKISTTLDSSAEFVKFVHTLSETLERFADNQDLEEIARRLRGVLSDIREVQLGSDFLSHLSKNELESVRLSKNFQELCLGTRCSPVSVKLNLQSGNGKDIHQIELGITFHKSLNVFGLHPIHITGGLSVHYNVHLFEFVVDIGGRISIPLIRSYFELLLSMNQHTGIEFQLAVDVFRSFGIQCKANLFTSEGSDVSILVTVGQKQYNLTATENVGELLLQTWRNVTGMVQSRLEKLQSCKDNMEPCKQAVIQGMADLGIFLGRGVEDAAKITHVAWTNILYSADAAKRMANKFLEDHEEDIRSATNTFVAKVKDGREFVLNTARSSMQYVKDHEEDILSVTNTFVAKVKDGREFVLNTTRSSMQYVKDHEEDIRSVTNTFVVKVKDGKEFVLNTAKSSMQYVKDHEKDIKEGAVKVANVATDFAENLLHVGESTVSWAFGCMNKRK